MKTYQKLMLGCAAIAPAFVMAGAAQAQVSGIAIVNPEAVILTAKAIDAANATIGATYKADLDKADARQQAMQAELLPLYSQLDTNKDKQISDAEIAAAQAAKSPVIGKIEAVQKSAQQDINRLNAPATRALAYALEQVALKYAPAVKTTADAKKISLVLAAGTVQYGTPAVDITNDVKAELDRSSPTVGTTPPANWQPSQQTVQLLQQYNQLVQAAQARAQQQRPATAPAAGAKAPTGR